MTLYDVIALVGGLALFLYGMNVMGNMLTKMSGSKLESILEKLTDNPLKAVLLGAGVTAVIQSSSATTVMVVGFVNSGIMKLGQAIGVIMGANIGTTVTSWILTLVGVEGNSLLVNLVKPANFSPIIAIIGVIMIMGAKKEKYKDIGTLMVGFAVLMYGMNAMSDAVKPLQNVPEFRELMVMFSNPVLGVIMGTVLTAIIQSSSASVGILQAMSATNAVTYGSAFPIIMGQNIGTCVTALISSIGTSKNAKRAACVHLSFNIIGTVVFMLLFYAVNAFVQFDFLNNSVSEMGIAVIHTVFNVMATAMLLPFRKQLEKLACFIVRDDKESKEKKDTESKRTIRKLDERFLDMPSFGIEQCQSVTVEMANATKEGLQLSLELLDGYNEEKFLRVKELEELVDHYEDEIGTYLVQLSAKGLTERDSQRLNMLLRMIGDFERISDHTMNLGSSAQELEVKNQTFSEEAKQELDVMLRAITDIVDTTFESFAKEDLEQALLVEPIEAAVDVLNDEIKKRHVARLRKGACTIEMGFILSDITTNLERVADHCSNIALCLIEVSSNSFDLHEYLGNRKKNDAEYRREKEEMLQKYALN